jgi:hypothetical protein
MVMSLKTSDTHEDASPHLSLIASASLFRHPLQVSDGVLSGFALADSNLAVRRERSRRLVAGDAHIASNARYEFGRFVTAALNKVLAEELDNISQMGLDLLDMDSERAAERISKVLNKFVEANWHLIEPAQIIKINRYEETQQRADMSPDLVREVRALLDANLIDAFRRTSP